MVDISSQDLDSHQGFIEENNLTVPLLADLDKHAAKAYSAKKLPRIPWVWCCRRWRRRYQSRAQASWMRPR